ncbi:uncharacterized protein LOC126260935 [Schistocerca nitens]|uniref:uncharacterized protein LOC126260935 n=1 Tax=Schistocerca nitens TaxID=7011 RepID=UPI002117E014|nr:uncharacterized protein LOC126260935 [Schistocerca nitens]
MRACILLVLGASVAVASVEGVSPDAYLSISNDECDESRLKWPCPEQCSMEIQPVYATCEHGRLETFVNCCTWHRDVCQFKRPCRFHSKAPRGGGAAREPGTWHSGETTY